MSSHPGATAPLDDARHFADRISGLRETTPGFWEVGTDTAISYPAAGHASSASVEPTSYWFNHRNALIASVVSRYPPSGPIVDVGGGNGYVSLGLRNAGFDSIVVEPGAAGARCAHDRGLPVIQAPFETLDVPNGAIAAAGLFDVLEHIGEDAAALDSLHATMSPGAMLYLTVPSFGWLWSSEDVYAGHFRRYMAQSLSRLIEKRGFAVRAAQPPGPVQRGAAGGDGGRSRAAGRSAGRGLRAQHAVGAAQGGGRRHDPVRLQLPAGGAAPLG